MNKMYTSGYIEEIVRLKLNSILGISEKILLLDDLTVLGLNSIKTIVLIVELEQVFDIEFQDEELLFEYFTNLKKIIGMLSTKRPVRVS